MPGEALFRALLWLHPHRFRERYAEEMLTVFRDGWREEVGGRGIRAAAGFWIRTLRGTLSVALEQRLGRGSGIGGGRSPGRAPEDPERDASRRRGVVFTTGGGAMDGWRREAGVVVRAIRRRPGFAALVMATFALGMGADTAVYAVLHGVLLSPLPYADADRLVRLYQVEEVEPDDLEDVPGMAFIELRERVRSVELVALYDYAVEGADLTGSDRPERVRILRVGSGYFRVLGAAPLLGRGFRRDEERDSAHVAVVRADVWERYLDADPEAPGRRVVTLDGIPYTVVGVMPRTFRDPLDEGVEVWIPQNLQRGGPNNFDNYYLTVVGRLSPGTSLEAARQEVTAVSRRFGELDPAAEGRRARLVPLHDDVVGSSRTMLLVLMGAAGFLLLIACVNVASLFLARGASLRREMAIRRALGSGRGRLMRRILLEGVILSVAGGLAGLAVGGALLKALVALAPPDLPRLGELGLGAPVLFQGAALSLGAGFLFALVPALHYSRPAGTGALVEGGHGVGSGPVRQRFRSGLVVCQISLALVLLVGAGVLVRSFRQLREVDLGFDAAGVRTWGLHLPDGRYADPARRASFQATLFERLRALPGVRYAGAISRLPATGDWFRWGTGLSDATGERDLESFIGADQRVVEGDVFRALGIPLLRGRLFGPRDDAEAPHRVVVNQALVRRLFLDRDPVGAELWYGAWRARVIGVVGDAAIGARGETMPKVYHSHRQFAGNRNWALTWVVKLETPLPGLASAVRREVAALDPLLVPFDFRPLAEIVGRGVARERFATMLVTVFSALAVLLAAVGIYGVLAYTVTRRRREIGVRLALGARGSAVRRMVVGKGLLLALGGVGLGLPAALLLGGLLRSLLFEVSPTDPWILSAVSMGMVAVALLASWVPALRATRVDPTETLRSE